MCPPQAYLNGGLLPLRELRWVGCYEVSKFRQYSAAEKSTVNQCTPDYFLMCKIS